MGRDLKKIIVHCSASDVESHDNVEIIRKWHVEENGWDDIGYHYVITKDGHVHLCRPISKVGAHCLGQNLESVGICLTGDKEFSPNQFFGLAWLCYELLTNNPTIHQVKPHSFYDDKKTCPNFDLGIFKIGSELDLHIAK